MQIDLAACVRALESVSDVRAAGIEVEMLAGEPKQVLEFVLDYHEQYDTPPTVAVIQEETGLPFEIPSDPPPPVDYIADKIKARWLGKQLSEVLRNPVNLLENGDPYEARRELLKAVSSIAMQQQPGVHDLRSPEFRRKFLEQYEKAEQATNNMSGIPSHWTEIDKETMGWQPGELYLLAAKKKVGKTWQMLKAAVEAWKAGYFPMIISMEMPLLIMARRFWAIHQRLRYEDVRRGKLGTMVKKRLFSFLETLENQDPPICIATRRRVNTPSDVEALVIDYQPDIVFLDGIYIMRSDQRRSAKWERLTEAMDSLNNIAIANSIPAFATTQFKRDKKHGSMQADDDDLAYADALGQYASMVLGALVNEDLRRQKKLIFKTLCARDYKPVHFIATMDLDTMDFSTDGLIDPAKISASPGGSKKNQVINY